MNEPHPLAVVRPTFVPPAAPAATVDLRQVAQDAKPVLLDLWGAIRFRQWWILGAGLAAAVLAAVFTLLMQPQYRSTALVLFEAGGKSRVVSIEEVYGGLGSNRETSTNQLEFLKSRDVSMRVIRKLELTRHPDFDPTRPGPLSWLGRSLRAIGVLPEREPLAAEWVDGIVLDRFQQRLQVEPVRQSQLVRITFESSDRQLAARVANEIATAYIQADLDARFNVTERANEWLNSRVAFLKSKLDAAESELQSYRERQGLVDTKSLSQGGTGKQLDELNQRLVEARVRRTMAEQAFNQVRPGSPNLSQVPAIVNHPAVQRARTTEIEAARRFNDASARYGSSHPAYRTAEQELRVARETAEREVETVAASIRKEFEAARAAEASLEQTLSTTRVSVQGINRKEIQQSALEREVDVNRQLYNLFLSRQRETSAASTFQSSPARLIDPAVAALRPFSPNTPLVTVGALVAALLLSALAVALLHRLDDKLKRADDVEAQVGSPLIVAVPKLADTDVPHAHRMMVDLPSSHFAETIRSISSAVQLMSLDAGRRVLLVTSAAPGEGKSTIASNLALLHARLGRTLLIEADLRRPVTATRLGLQEDLPGLTDFVAGTRPPAECVHTLDFSSLFVMPCGQLMPNAAELFGTQAFGEALKSLSASYDHVIIDAAPVRPVSDALLLSRHATGVVFVAASDSTPAPLVRWAIQRLNVAGARLFGVVLNRYDLDRAEKYYGEYASYSDYATSAKPPRVADGP